MVRSIQVREARGHRERRSPTDSLTEEGHGKGIASTSQRHQKQETHILKETHSQETELPDNMEDKKTDAEPQRPTRSSTQREQLQTVAAQLEKQIINQILAEREGIPEEQRERVQRTQERALIQSLITARGEAPERWTDQSVLEETEGQLTKATFSKRKDI